MKTMTNRERILAVLQRREHDRVPFVQYDDMAGPNAEIWRLVGRNNLGVIRWTTAHRLVAPNCRILEQPISWHGYAGVRRILRTPGGTLFEERLTEPAHGSETIRKHFIQTIDDYAVYMSYLRDVSVLKDAALFLRDQRAMGDDGLPLVDVGRTPFQHLWIEEVALTDLCGHLADEPALVGECMELLAGIQRRIFATVLQVHRRHPIPFIVVPDNITAPAIGRRNFSRYCLPLYRELVGMFREEGVPVLVHMDGDLKPLWKLIGEAGIDGIDSLTPPPSNDTSVGQARSLWPDMRLWVNLPSAVHHFGPQAVYEQTGRILAEDGHSGLLQIQISENIPVGAWRTSFPAIVTAIEEFGTP